MSASPMHDERKRADSLLSALERRFAIRAVRLVPSWLESHHLTLLTVIWSALMLLCCNPRSCRPRAGSGPSRPSSSFRYLTDAVDGKVGVMRGAGLVRWGYYMDHFLDYVFLCAILIGYGLMLPDGLQQLMTWTLAIAGGFMVHAFLEFGATGELSLSYLKIGPAEIRLIFIAINITLLTFGRSSMVVVCPAGPADQRRCPDRWCAAHNGGYAGWTGPADGRRQTRRLLVPVKSRAMFFAESRWVIDALEPITARLRTAIDVGAGNAKYQAERRTDPVHDFLRARNVQTHNTDADAKARCDVCADLTDARTVPACDHRRYDLVLCTSVLEHVTDVHRPPRATLAIRLTGRRAGTCWSPCRARYPPHRSPPSTRATGRPNHETSRRLFADLAVVALGDHPPAARQVVPLADLPRRPSPIPRVSCVLLRKASIVS